MNKKVIAALSYHAGFRSSPDHLRLCAKESQDEVDVQLKYLRTGVDHRGALTPETRKIHADAWQYHLDLTNALEMAATALESGRSWDEVMRDFERRAGL